MRPTRTASRSFPKARMCVLLLRQATMGRGSCGGLTHTMTGWISPPSAGRLGAKAWNMTPDFFRLLSARSADRLYQDFRQVIEVRHAQPVCDPHWRRSIRLSRWYCAGRVPRAAPVRDHPIEIAVSDADSGDEA